MVKNVQPFLIHALREVCLFFFLNCYHRTSIQTKYNVKHVLKNQTVYVQTANDQIVESGVCYYYYYYYYYYHYHYYCLFIPHLFFLWYLGKAGSVLVAFHGCFYLYSRRNRTQTVLALKMYLYSILYSILDNEIPTQFLHRCSAVPVAEPTNGSPIRRNKAEWYT